MNENYSNREIDSHFANVNENIGEIKDLVVELNNRVGIQNGRVGKLEGRSTWLTGVGATAIFLFGIIISLIVYSFQLSQENLKQSIFLEISKQNQPINIDDIRDRAKELKAETELLQTQLDNTDGK